MFHQEITFDRFVRGLLFLLGAVAVIWLLRYLSNVLLPFFIAWIAAYMLYPVVRFLQYRCHLRYRIPCIFISMLLVLAAIAGVFMLVVPGIVAEGGRLGTLATTLAQHHLGGDTIIAQTITQFVEQYLNKNAIVELISKDQVQTALQTLILEAWNVLSQTVGILMGVLTVFVVLLYTFFLLLDYENIVEGWADMVPAPQRPFLQQLVSDVAEGMNSYFRGQSLIALSVGILFAIGFQIVGLPMAIGLGLFIGVLNLVPYLQLLGFLPALLCVTMRSLDTGQNFWIVLLWTLVVFAVVQAIQDLVLTPRIMGKAMGLSPTVILLSLSVWGALLGFIGLIIALPLTTLCISYYKRYLLKQAQ
ncbi:MAG: AI-2E family transporter [Bacteroidaceae bacterium]|nr:AI-2E family transporter [Prevotellaceae bacterium]MDY5632718.1 AI-2E family transporter [Bacteroidaceae bacterium]